MELRDLIVTPLLLIVIYIVAYMIRPYVTDSITRRYFFPALTVRIIGALAVGFIYQFYYHGGDTFAYHTHGSRHIWEAFMKSPLQGYKLLVSQGYYGPGYWEFAEKIWYYRDPQSYFVIRIAAIFDLITFSSYSGTAVIFSLLSFTGGWLLFTTFSKMYPSITTWIAAGCLFVPSLFFWGAGILKDTLTLAFLGVATYCCYQIFILYKVRLFNVLILFFSFYVIYSVKKYILMSFLAALVVWIATQYFSKIQSSVLRILIMPFASISCFLLSYYAINKVTEGDPKYALSNIAETSRVTAYDIRYWTGKDAGSGYTLGNLDGTFLGMIKLAPQAVNVSLFRPYIWEVRNPLMLLSAFESCALLILTLYVLIKVKSNLFTAIQSPAVVFCLIFSFIFAFGVGVSTFNFGSLARYRIPLIPYYIVALGIIYQGWKSRVLNKDNYSTENNLR